MRSAARLTVLGLCGAILAGSPAAAQSVADGSSAPYADVNLRREDGTPGVFAVHDRGPYYTVSAYLPRTRPGREAEDLADLARMVMMRSALLALENGRQHFSIVGEIGTATTGARDVQLPASPAQSEPGQYYGRDGNGNQVYIPGREIPGAPGGVSRDPGFFGRKATIQVWTRLEAQAIEAGAERGPGAPLLPAEQYYADNAARTPGDWPSLIAIYEDAARRFERLSTAGGVEGRHARYTTGYVNFRLAALHLAAGRRQEAEAAKARGDAAVERVVRIDG